MNEVTSREDSVDDFLTPSMDATGAIKIKKSSKEGSLPETSEELRAKFRVLSAAWCLLWVRYLKPWLSDMNPSVWTRYVEYLLGNRVAALKSEIEIDGSKSTTTVPWQLILNYNLELRKSACTRVVE